MKGYADRWIGDRLGVCLYVCVYDPGLCRCSAAVWHRRGRNDRNPESALSRRGVSGLRMEDEMRREAVGECVWAGCSDQGKRDKVWPRKEPE